MNRRGWKPAPLVFLENFIIKILIVVFYYNSRYIFFIKPHGRDITRLLVVVVMRMAKGHWFIPTKQYRDSDMWIDNPIPKAHCDIT